MCVGVQAQEDHELSIRFVIWREEAVCSSSSCRLVKGRPRNAIVYGDGAMRLPAVGTHVLLSLPFDT